MLLSLRDRLLYLAANRDWVFALLDPSLGFSKGDLAFCLGRLCSSLVGRVTRHALSLVRKVPNLWMYGEIDGLNGIELPDNLPVPPCGYNYLDPLGLDESRAPYISTAQHTSSLI